MSQECTEKVRPVSAGREAALGYVRSDCSRFTPTFTKSSRSAELIPPTGGYKRLRYPLCLHAALIQLKNRTNDEIFSYGYVTGFYRFRVCR